MKHVDPRVDAYIEKAAEFAQPLLRHMRAVVHDLCPDVHETIKWSFPVFEYRGESLCSMAAFKQHCAFGFWKVPLMDDPHGLLQERDEKSMGQFGRLTSLKDFPSKARLKPYMVQAMKLNEEGVKVIRSTSTKEKKPIVVPSDLKAALAKNPSAKENFAAFSPSHQREYIEWISSAKKEETRARRLSVAIQNISQAKSQNWKYERTSKKK